MGGLGWPWAALGGQGRPWAHQLVSLLSPSHGWVTDPARGVAEGLEVMRGAPDAMLSTSRCSVVITIILLVTEVPHVREASSAVSLVLPLFVVIPKGRRLEQGGWQPATASHCGCLVLVLNLATARCGARPTLARAAPVRVLQGSVSREVAEANENAQGKAALPRSCCVSNTRGDYPAIRSEHPGDKARALK